MHFVVWFLFWMYFSVLLVLNKWLLLRNDIGVLLLSVYVISCEISLLSWKITLSLFLMLSKGEKSAQSRQPKMPTTNSRFLQIALDYKRKGECAKCVNTACCLSRWFIQVVIIKKGEYVKTKCHTTYDIKFRWWQKTIMHVYKQMQHITHHILF